MASRSRVSGKTWMVGKHEVTQKMTAINLDYHSSCESKQVLCLLLHWYFFSSRPNKHRSWRYTRAYPFPLVTTRVIRVPH